jgi:hypothetical protein
MSAALSVAEIHQPTEVVSFAEMEGQHVELLPSRTTLACAPVAGEVVPGESLPSDVLAGLQVIPEGANAKC